MTPFTQTQTVDLLQRLESNNLFYRALWDLSELYFTDTTETAAVCIVSGQIHMVFNEDFWNSLSPKGQLFIVCHEQLHLMLDHINRLKFNQGNVHLKNIACDVAVNHFLINNYFFEKSDIINWERYCWVDTVFPNQHISDNETAEHYYSMLVQKHARGDKIEGYTLDDHQYSDGVSMDPTIKEAIQSAITESVNDGVGFDPGELIQGHLPRNKTQTLHADTTPDQSWKTLYMSIPKKLFSTKNQQSWVFTDRRQQLISQSVILPSDRDTDTLDKVKMHVYLDTSGSCLAHSKYFLESALTLPPNMFTVAYFGFDNKVYDIPNKPPYNLTGFGTTSFQTVVNHMESYGNAIDGAVVFTDGFASQPTCKHPSKWYWLLTPHGTDKYIPRKSSSYFLSETNWNKR